MAEEIFNYLCSDKYCRQVAKWLNEQCDLSSYFRPTDALFYYFTDETPAVRYTFRCNNTAFKIDTIFNFSDDINDVKKLDLAKYLHKVNIILDILPSSISSTTTSMSKTEVNHFIKMIESFATNIDYFVFNDRENDCCSLKHIIECGLEASVITEE